MGRFIDLTGKKFNMLTVLSVCKERQGKKIFYECRCDCGTVKTIESNAIKSGHTRSCGCWKSLQTFKSLTPEHAIWRAMKKRCLNKNVKCYKRYGGRGIKICKRWMTFENFLEDMGKRPTPKHSLDRIDNDSGYSPGNCRWASPMEQANNKSNNRILSHNGKTMTMAQWGRETDVPATIIEARINRLKWSVEKALTTPVGKGNNQWTK